MGGLSHQPPTWQAKATQNICGGAGIGGALADQRSAFAHARACTCVLCGSGLPGGGLVAEASHIMREL